MSRGSQGNAAPKLRNGVMRRGSTWSYVIRVTDSRGVSKPRWVGGFPTEAAAKRARDEARIAASRGDFVDRSTLTVRTTSTSGFWRTPWRSSPGRERGTRT